MFIPTCRRLALGCLISLTLLAVGCTDRPHPLDPEAALPLAAAGGAEVVQVAPPTGDLAVDRANIMAALEQVGPGGTVQFARGTYVIGVPIPFSADFIRVTVPHVTLLGHRRGTTLRGCEPEEFVFGGCVGLELSGGHQTVRNLTFEEMHFSLVLGRFALLGPVEEARTGGYRIEGNTFRNSIQGVHQAGQWPEPALVRNNQFINLFAAVVVGGMTVYVLDNRISAPEPERVPAVGIPGGAIAVSPASAGLSGRCDHNLIARNRIEGYAEGVMIVLYGPAAGCRFNVIHDNRILNSRAFAPWQDGTPLALINHTDQEGLIEYNLIEGNRVNGAEGTGVEILRASRNVILNNRITDVRWRDLPWPGRPSEANGSGVWVSPGSNENSILVNTFARIASYEVVLLGDRNLVATRSRRDTVRDLGTGNRVIGPGSVTTEAASVDGSAAAAPAAVERGEAAQTLEQRFGDSAWWLGRGARQEAAPR